MIELKHERQRYNWDCGVACVLMVLPRRDKQHLLDNFAEVCKEEGFNRSTWTIDLCYLLRRYRIAHTYSTVTLGVHPGYQGHPFYDSIIGGDRDRVDKRFACAAANGLNITQRRVALSELLNHLDLALGPIVILTNARFLRCDRCKINRLSLELRQCLRWPPSYQGHYIVLCGHARDRRRLLYRNPSLGDHVCSIGYAALDAARLCYGTDEDVIFITSSTNNETHCT